MKIAMMWSGALCALILAACQKQPAQTNLSNAQTAAPPAPPHRLAPRPEEMKSPYAPPGVYFLLSRTSVETGSGYFSYAPGSKVIRSGGKYVTADGRSISLRADQITNDLRLAAKAAGNDVKLLAAIQTSIRNTLATPNHMPPPADENILHARPETQPKLDGDDRKNDRSRLNAN